MLFPIYYSNILVYFFYYTNTLAINVYTSFLENILAIILYWQVFYGRIIEMKYNC